MGVTVGLADVYRRLGHSVNFLSFADLPQGLPFRGKALLFPEFMAWKLRNTPAEVVDASCGDAWLWAYLRRSRRRRPPLLVTRSHGLVHIADIARRNEARRGGLDLSWKYPLYWGGFRLWEVAMSFRQADLCLFLNEEERTFAVKNFGLSEDDVRVVDNGIPAFLLGQSFEEPEPLAATFGILHLGSFLPLKGVRYAVSAMSTILRRHPEAHGSFLGTGCSPEEVLDAFDDDLRPRIAVVPKYRRENLPALLRGHSVVLSATLKEGFGLSILEAMACGLVPVTSAAAGPLQFISSEENGLVAPLADGPALEAALERLIQEPDLLGRLREAAIATAQRYSWERVARETLDLYAEAMERRARV